MPPNILGVAPNLGPIFLRLKIANFWQDDKNFTLKNYHKIAFYKGTVISWQKVIKPWQIASFMRRQLPSFYELTRSQSYDRELQRQRCKFFQRHG
jgi:hypothetical protein